MAETGGEEPWEEGVRGGWRVTACSLALSLFLRVALRRFWNDPHFVLKGRKEARRAGCEQLTSGLSLIPEPRCTASNLVDGGEQRPGEVR